MKTISGVEIRVKANQSKRTFTIRKEGQKFRTDKMNRVDFESNENNTANDWQDFLNGSNSYQLIRK